MPKKYLIIGGIPTDNPSSIGGVTILLQQLLDYFDEKQIDYILIRTNKYFTNEDKLAFIKNYLYVIFYFFKYIRSVDIVFVNVASNGMYYLSPVLLFFSKVFKTPYISRIFGGNSIELYEDTTYFKRKLLNYVFVHSDVLFFETKYLIDYFKSFNPNTYWFPNVRKKADTLRNGAFNKRFIFVGHVKKEKGVLELLEASNMLDNSFTIDIYGPIDENMKDVKFNKFKADYKGSLNPEKVLDTLRLYDVLVLPTYWKGEGYPGVILEALSIGMPIIATNLKGICEMVDSSCGILIEVKNSQLLATAIKSINNENYPLLSQNALKKFDDFEYQNVYKRIVSISDTKTKCS